MYSSQIYLYDQKYTVVLRDTSNTEIQTRRHRTVYARDLKLHKGTDNVLLFVFQNQDQKPVNITSMTFTFKIMNREGTKVLLNKDMEITAATGGKAKVTITEGELDDISAQRANYSIEKFLSSDGLYEASLVDDDLGGRGAIDIMDSVYPEYVDSTEITIPTFARDSEATSTTHFSSTFSGGDNGSMTVQYKPSTFSGSVQLQGTAGVSGLYYDIGDTVSLSASSTTGYIHFSGFHPTVRLKIVNTSGNIASLKVR